LKTGELKAIAISSAKKSAVLPEVPTVMDSGIKGYEVYAWNGLAVPAKTPKPIIDKLNREVNAVLNQPEVKNRLLELGIDPIGGSAEDLKSLLNDEIDKWNHLVSSLKIERQ
jgi:tripartite-type tricarboxylate transporter receptor subunit TctC